MQDEVPKFENEKDLYLKGHNYYSGKDVDFEEMIVGDGHRTGTGGVRGEKAWKLTVFKESNKARLQTVNGGMGGDNYEDESFTCDKVVFVDTIVKRDFSWEKAVASVTFKFDGCKDITKGRKVCDIKIAEGTGLKWGTKVNPKAVFCASN